MKGAPDAHLGPEIQDATRPEGTVVGLMNFRRLMLAYIPDLIDAVAEIFMQALRRVLVASTHDIL